MSFPIKEIKGSITIYQKEKKWWVESIINLHFNIKLFASYFNSKR